MTCLQETEINPDAYISTLTITMTWMTMNLHQHTQVLLETCRQAYYTGVWWQLIMYCNQNFKQNISQHKKPDFDTKCQSVSVCLLLLNKVFACLVLAGLGKPSFRSHQIVGTACVLLTYGVLCFEAFVYNAGVSTKP